MMRGLRRPPWLASPCVCRCLVKRVASIPGGRCQRYDRTRATLLGGMYQISARVWSVQNRHPDTVGQPPSNEIGVPNMPSLKAKKLGKLPQEQVLLEL